MFADRTKWNLASNRLGEILAEWRKLSKPFFDLTISNPTECGFEYDKSAILQALSQSEALSYRPDPRGLLSARQAVTQYYADHGAVVSSEDIVLTTSTSEAYSFIFRTLCNPGDEILVPTPGYPLFGFLADIQDVKLLPYPLLYDHGWQIDFHLLERTITPRTRGVIVVHPNNPTGHFTKPGEVLKLNEICARTGMAIIADEVFLDFALDRKPRTFAGNHNVLTFTLSGLSKISGLPQMKVAWAAISGTETLKSEAVGRMEVIADTYLSLNTPVQLAVPEFLNQRRRFAPQVKERTVRNLQELDHQLSENDSCARLIVEGGWYAVLRVPAIRADEDFAIELLKAQGVYIHPGHFYDFPSDGYLIASLITREQEFAEGIARLLSFV